MTDSDCVATGQGCHTHHGAGRVAGGELLILATVCVCMRRGQAQRATNMTCAAPPGLRKIPPCRPAGLTSRRARSSQLVCDCLLWHQENVIPGLTQFPLGSRQGHRRRVLEPGARDSQGWASKELRACILSCCAGERRQGLLANNSSHSGSQGQGQRDLQGPPLLGQRRPGSSLACGPLPAVPTWTHCGGSRLGDRHSALRHKPVLLCTPTLPQAPRWPRPLHGDHAQRTTGPSGTHLRDWQEAFHRGGKLRHSAQRLHRWEGQRSPLPECPCVCSSNASLPPILGDTLGCRWVPAGSLPQLPSSLERAASGVGGGGGTVQNNRKPGCCTTHKQVCTERTERKQCAAAGEPHKGVLFVDAGAGH